AGALSHLVSHTARFLQLALRARAAVPADAGAAETAWVGGRCQWQKKEPAVANASAGSLINCRQRPTLPYSFPYSTIGGSRLNFRVRNGNGWNPAPMTTGKRGAWGPPFAGYASYGGQAAAACPP